MSDSIGGGLTPKIITGLPAVKANPRADFIPDMFDQLIGTKGYRMFWSRAGVCPCELNDQTEQPDPNCPLCKGHSYFWTCPDLAVVAGASKDSFGNPIELNTAGDGVMIYVMKSSLTQDVQVFEKFGEWVFGTSKLTVQPQNKLGYRDRLVEVDSVMTWVQIIESRGLITIPITGGYNKSGLRYPVVEVNFLRSLSTVYQQNTDYELTPNGEIRWLITPPVTGTRLSIHCLVHPVWVVMEHINSYRDSLVAFKTKTKADEFRRLPIQAVAKLDYLVEGL